MTRKNFFIVPCLLFFWAAAGTWAGAATALDSVTIGYASFSALHAHVDCG